jgi:hypothetical protein
VVEPEPVCEQARNASLEQVEARDHVFPDPEKDVDGQGCAARELSERIAAQSDAPGGI